MLFKMLEEALKEDEKKCVFTGVTTNSFIGITINVCLFSDKIKWNDQKYTFRNLAIEVNVNVIICEPNESCVASQKYGNNVG